MSIIPVIAVLAAIGACLWNIVSPLVSACAMFVVFCFYIIPIGIYTIMEISDAGTYFKLALNKIINE